MNESWVFVGLGNPGRRYAKTRHNIGFMALDRVRVSWGFPQWREASRFSAQLSRGQFRGSKVILVKPVTYMNESGRSVGPLARYHRIPPARLCVLHDDVDLPLGRMKIKSGGGNAGHNGLRSLDQHLGCSDYLRIRCGVGRPEVGDVVDFVLSEFAAAEQDATSQLVEGAEQALSLILEVGPKEAMNQFNGRT